MGKYEGPSHFLRVTGAGKPSTKASPPLARRKQGYMRGESSPHVSWGRPNSCGPSQKEKEGEELEATLALSEKDL